MARMALSFGACPVCGDDVPRTVQLAVGLQKEIFHCPDHGRIPYEPRQVPLAALSGSGLLGHGHHQTMTGLELVH